MSSENKTISNISDNTKNDIISPMTNVGMTDVGSGSWCIKGTPTFHNTYWQSNSNLICENEYVKKVCTNDVTGAELYKCDISTN
jgi:hypothetical protein